MTSPRAPRATWAILLVVVDKRGNEESQCLQTTRRCLACAVQLAHQTKLTWVRLVGAQWHPMRWYVVDTGNYERLVPGRLINEGVRHGCTKGKNRRFHA